MKVSNDSESIYDLSITEKDLVESDEAIEQFDYLYNIFEIITYLKENDLNTHSREFENLVKKHNLDIEMAQMIDYDLHSDFELTIKNVENPKSLRVLWKDSFENAKEGDKINGGTVIGIFTLTIWIYLDKEDDHTFCCKSECCH